MSWGAVAVGGAMLANGVTQTIASGKAADAAQGAANAQLAAAQANKADILAMGSRNQNAAMNLADATPQELATLDQTYKAATTNLQNQQKLIDSINPSIMEASKQALTLLRGGSAAVNQPLMAQRDMQRTKLVNQLREQYGPGAESSSLGQKVLQSFDMDSNSMFSQNNQNSLQQLFGIANTNTNALMNPAISGLQQVGQGYSALQDRKLNTQVNTGNAMLAGLSGANQALIQNAGAPYVGAAVQAQGLSSLSNNISNTVNTFGMMNMLKPAAAAPSPGSYNMPTPNATSGGYWGKNPYE